MMTLAMLILLELPRVPKDRLGMAGGLFFTAAEVGGVLGPVTFGVLSQATGGFAAPLVVLTALCLGLLGLLAALARTPWRG
jgi:cyanate permease